MRMTKLKSQASILSRLALMIMLVALPSTAAQEENPTVRVSEISLRRAATQVVMPEYPTREGAANGVGVAEILTDMNGDVSKINILEAPTKSAADSITNAVRQWKFKLSYKDGKPVKYLSKLTFYFSYEHGKGYVRNPKAIGK
jgi:outer membrane biosynthesis protein TonB